VKTARALAITAAGAGAGLAGYLGLVTGAVTVDLGVGRRVRPLGPIEVIIEAPRHLVYEAACAPYAVRQTRAMREKVQVLERGQGMVLAAHRTPLGAFLGRPLAATTTETVTFTPPELIGFRLLRGPVPHVAETFRLTELEPRRTRLRYEGELGTDLWALGERWGGLVAGIWEETVRGSLDQIKAEAERLA
jgi:hypothetical protein